MIHHGKPGMTATWHWTPHWPQPTKTCFLPSATVLTLTSGWPGYSGPGWITGDSPGHPGTGTCVARRRPGNTGRRHFPESVFPDRPRGRSGTAVRPSSRRTALLLLWLVLPAVALGVPVYFLSPLLSRSAVSAAYLILAVFLADLVLGVVAMVAVAVRREDRRFSLSSAAPGAAGHRARRWLAGWSTVGCNATAWQRPSAPVPTRRSATLDLVRSPGAVGLIPRLPAGRAGSRPTEPVPQGRYGTELRYRSAPRCHARVFHQLVEPGPPA